MRVRGHLTIFFSLVLISILSLLIVILESARSSAIRYRLALAADSSLASLFAGYQHELFEEYGLLFLWNGEAQILNTIEDYFNPYFYPEDGFALYPMSILSIETMDIVSMPDEGGTIFEAEILKGLGISVAKEYLEEFLSGIDLIAQGESTHEEVYDSSKDVLGNLQEEQDETIDAAFFDKVARAIGNSGVTKEVIKGFVLSDKSIDGSLLPSKVSVVDKQSKSDLTDILAVHQYIKKYFSSFTTEKSTFKESNGLAYEQEYILNGFLTDEDNLAATIGKLLAIREGMNLLHIFRNAKKMNVVNLAAAALALLFEAPNLQEAIKVLLIVLWAYQESIGDLKVLLSGGNVSLVKSDDEWGTNLTSIIGIDIDFGEELKGQSETAEKGFSYEAYLSFLLWTESQQEKLYRMMDLLQLNFSGRFSGFSVNWCISSLSIEVCIKDYYGRERRIVRSRNYT